MASNRRELLLFFVMFIFTGNSHCLSSDHIQVAHVQQISSKFDTLDKELPTHVTVQFQAHKHNIQLQLLKKQDFSSDIPVCTVGNNNETVCTTDHNMENRYGLYQDPEKLAAVILELVKQNDTKNTILKLNGEFSVNDELFEIESDNINSQMSSEKNYHYIKRRSVLKTVNNETVLNPEKEQDFKRRYGVELLVIVGHSIYKKFLKETNNNITECVRRIRYYFSHIVNSIDLRYSLIEADFELYVRLSGFLIIKNASSTPFIKNSFIYINGRVKLNGVTAIDGLKEFLKSRNSSLHFDHAMMFTDYDTFNPRTRILGSTFASAICTPGHISLIVDHGAYTSGGTAAHELAHNLGVTDHDGEGTAKECPTEHHYIMSPVTGILNNITNDSGFKFSDCSVRQLGENLKVLEKNDNNCLNNEAHIINSKEFLSNIEKLPGQIYTVHDQCRYLYGPDSFMCPPLYPSEICYKMLCYITSTKKCLSESGLRAAIGTPCGYQKGCYFGNCVANISQQLVADDCPYPDLPALVDCNLSSPTICKNKEFYKRCCASCNRDFTEEDMCKNVPVSIMSKYNCNEFLLAHGLIQCTKDIMSLCCKSCKELRSQLTLKPVSTDSCKDRDIKFNGMNCPKLVVMYGLKACLRYDVRAVCCASCRRIELQSNKMKMEKNKNLS